MEKFTTFTTRIAPLPHDNIDTDQVIPARFLKTTTKQGLGDQLFHDWRYDADRNPNPEFILNKPEGRSAQVLLAGDNFGCGSSREHAPWALTDYGFRAIISTSFADIFRGNALKNSLLPIVVSDEVHSALLDAVTRDPGVMVMVDLAEQKLTLPDGSAVTFPIDEFSKHCLLEGIDELGYILQQEPAIAVFEGKRVLTVDTLHA